MLLIKGSRYIHLIFFKDEVDLFSPVVEPYFRPLVLLLAAVTLFFRSLLVMANGGIGSYVRFNLQKI
jgi:hypothetical protein